MAENVDLVAAMKNRIHCGMEKLEESIGCDRRRKKETFICQWHTIRCSSAQSNSNYSTLTGVSLGMLPYSCDISLRVKGKYKTVVRSAMMPRHGQWIRHKRRSWVPRK